MSNTHPLTVLPLPNGGAFVFSPCPGTKGLDLIGSIKQIQAESIDAVISMLPDHELDYLNVSELGKLVEEAGMQWFQLPIEDDCAPEAPFHDAFTPHKNTLLSLVNSNKKILIHCRGGTGRTGLLAAILLLESGLEWPEVKSLIQSVRPKSLTLTPHLQYLKQAYQLN